MQLEGLNEKQKEAVLETDGPILILAGAGSGKTRVLTTKIAYLIKEKNINPENILAITFTNKAAREMKDRVISILGPIAYKIQISTFHSFGLSILRSHYKLLGFHENFTILDSDDTLTVIKKILKDLNLDPKDYNPRAIRNRISSCKNELMDASQYYRFANTEFEEKVYQVYKQYEKKLKSNNSLDFDDLLMLPIVLFKKYPDVLRKYQEIFKYVLIDEYQDTNSAQYTITKLISAKYKNICVVGDESQSIYSFRGSDYRNILNFEKDYKNAKVILLEQNYRSTKTILEAANNIIKNNKQRKDKNLWTENEEGLKIKYNRAYDEKDEAFYVMSEIKKLIENGTSKSEIAILYRTNAQSRTMEEALLRENIPYKVVGSFYFYNRKEIKDLISYLKLIYNKYDDISLLRIINTPKRGIGLKTIADLTNKASMSNKSIYEVIESKKELEFKKLIDDLRLESENCSLTELVDIILDKTGMRKELISEGTMESEIRLENLEEFKSITKNFEEQRGIVSLEEFLLEISLVSDITEHKSDTDVITLMTVHSAKGLEFDYVFIIGMEEGIFPHKNSFFSTEDIEEERRLCYVAITRAKKQVWLVNAKRRLLYGLDNSNVPSRFINEIDNKYLDLKEEKGIKINKEDMIDENVDFNIGDHVFHDEFKEGVIISIDNKVMTIAFNHPHGIKKMIKGHKSIKKV